MKINGQEIEIHSFILANISRVISRIDPKLFNRIIHCRSDFPLYFGRSSLFVDIAIFSAVVFQSNLPKACKMSWMQLVQCQNYIIRKTVWRKFKSIEELFFHQLLDWFTNVPIDHHQGLGKRTLLSDLTQKQEIMGSGHHLKHRSIIVVPN